MLAVIDTNVLVSASINRSGVPALLVDRVRKLDLTPVVSDAILAEYLEVLHRARFRFPSEWVNELLDDMAALGLHAQPVLLNTASLPDPDDAPFIAAGLWAGCPVVTGNARHFPADCGVEVWSPAQCLERLTG